MPSMAFSDLMRLKEQLGRPLIMGHRGAMGHAPENTMASFQLAQRMGVEAIELDVHLSRDGVLVVHHDETLERTTNGQGELSALTLAQLQELDAGRHFSSEFAGERIPTLEEVLVWARGHALPVVIEFKRNLNVKAIVQAAIALVERLEAGDNVAFISFDHFVPAGLKQARPDWCTGVLYAGRPIDSVELAHKAGADGLLPNFYFVEKDMVEAAHAAGKWVGCWAPNTPREMAYALSQDVDMIGTNFPDRLHDLLKQG
ncbi:MAG: glycerophosphodiester phosphodiesterase family protein [Candidatus Sericytochromatia bacterium]|nr:glycerophosphodiester phosphodiesterase family protein [Candidatus Sericytochromatia bacterium]